MKSLNPDKLYVEYRGDATKTEPVNKRKYTLTHSDLTADLFLTIGQEYAYDKVNDLRDEVLAEWRAEGGYPFLYVYVYINGKMHPAASAMRNTIFRRELLLALQAIRYGDRSFFAAYPDLDNAPIWIYFHSQNPDYMRFEKWGIGKDYITPLHR